MIDFTQPYPIFFDKMPFSIVWAKLDGTIVNSNITTEKILGYTKEDLVGKHFKQIVVYPEKFLPILTKKHEEILNGEAEGQLELQAYKKDRSLIWVNLHYSLIQHENQTIIQIISQDITGEKEAKYQLKLQHTLLNNTFNSLLDAIFILDASNPPKILDCNNAVVQIFGYKKEEIVGNSTAFLHVNAESLKKFQSMLYQAMETKPISFHLSEFQMKRKDGSTFYSEHSVSQLLNEERERIGWVSLVRDITERKLAENKIRESEKKYRQLMEDAQEGIWVIDSNAITTFINQTMAEMLGYTIDEMLGKSLFLFMDEDSIKIAEKLVARRKQGIKESHEFEFLRKDGSRIYTRVGTSPIMDESRNYMGALAFVTDITEQKQMEKDRKKIELEIIKTNSRLQYLLNSSPAVIYSAMPSGNYPSTFISENVKDMTGYDSKDFINNPDFWIVHVHPEDRSIVFKEVPQLFQKKIHDYKYRFKCKDGKYIWISDKMELLYDTKGNPLEIVGCLTDISDLKQVEQQLLESEEKYHFLFDNSPVFITIIDKSGVIIDCNKVIEELIDYPKEEIIGKHFEDLMTLDPKELPRLMNQYKMLSKGLEVKPFDFEIITKTGEHRWVNILISLLRKESEIVGFQIIANDVTARKIAEENKTRIIKELKEVDRLKDEFYADISHEYRTPLTAIKGFTELLLQSNNLNKNQLADLQTILRNEQRLEHLVNEILAYSRLKSGRVPFIKDKFRLSNICKDLKNELAPLIAEKQLIIEEEFHPDEELVFDQEQITSVIKNLCSNAIKFSFSGGKIIIRSIIKNGLWTVSIRDFGIGIAKEDLPKLFTRFIKLKSSEQMNVDGIGIGLALCKNIIDVYGGKIWVESDGLNKGTTFLFQLKLDQITPTENM